MALRVGSEMVHLILWCVRADCTMHAPEIAACVEDQFDVALLPGTITYWLHRYGYQRKRVWVVHCLHPVHSRLAGPHPL